MIEAWGRADPRHRNWPVVYTIAGQRQAYVGQTGNPASRLKQHRKTPAKRDQLDLVRVVLDPSFNVSACLDLESYLISHLASDGRYTMLNGHGGMIDADYYDRERYRRTFEEIFEALRADGLFDKTLAEIHNSNLFKLSPYKSLTPDQAAAVEDIVDGLLTDVEADQGGAIVVQGDPGTGKTIVGIYLMKLLADIGSTAEDTKPEETARFADYFVDGNRELLTGARIGIVVPQKSLRTSLRKVFKTVPGLSPDMVMTPYDVGKSTEHFDILIVDEAHRLTQYGKQSMGTLTRDFREITTRLFGEFDPDRTQLDWIIAKSRHQVFLLDALQSVRPIDVPPEALKSLVESAERDQRRFRLTSQLRVGAGGDYLDYLRRVMNAQADSPLAFPGYDLRFFDDAGTMHDAIRARDAEHGLARMVAGFAWRYVSKTDKSRYDIELDGRQWQWNQTEVDWITSPGALEEIGSIHTVQGYDLNYAGVIIGPDLRFRDGRIVFDRDSYFDQGRAWNNRLRGRTYTDEDIREYVLNVYRVLLSRGICGTYVYVCDPALREYLRPYFGG